MSILIIEVIHESLLVFAAYSVIEVLSVGKIGLFSVFFINFAKH